MLGVLREARVDVRWLGLRFPRVYAPLSLHRTKMFHQRQRPVRDIAEQDGALRRSDGAVRRATASATALATTALTTAALATTAVSEAARASRSALQSVSRPGAGTCHL